MTIDPQASRSPCTSAANKLSRNRTRPTPRMSHRRRIRPAINRAAERARRLASDRAPKINRRTRARLRHLTTRRITHQIPWALSDEAQRLTIIDDSRSQRSRIVARQARRHTLPLHQLADRPPIASGNRRFGEVAAILHEPPSADHDISNGRARRREHERVENRILHTPDK